MEMDKYIDFLHSYINFTTEKEYISNKERINLINDIKKTIQEPITKKTIQEVYEMLLDLQYLNDRQHMLTQTKESLKYLTKYC